MCCSFFVWHMPHVRCEGVNILFSCVCIVVGVCDWHARKLQRIKMITATKDDSNKQLVLIPRISKYRYWHQCIGQPAYFNFMFFSDHKQTRCNVFSTDISNKVVSKRCPQYFETSSQLRFHFTLIFSFVSDYLICFYCYGYPTFHGSE